MDPAPPPAGPEGDAPGRFGPGAAGRAESLREETASHDPEASAPVRGHPPEETLGKRLPRAWGILLGLLLALLGTGMLALVLWTLERLYGTR